MLACPSWAQVNKKSVPDVGGGGGLEIANVAGKLEAVQGGSLKILDAAKAESLIVLDPRTTVKYSGQAKPAWLSTGLMVRFSARLDQQGNAQASIKTLEAFVPDTNRRMSLDEMRNQTAGLYPEGSTLGTVTKGLFNEKKSDSKKADDKKSTKRTEKKGAAKNEPDENQGASSTFQGYRVVGQVLNHQRGVLLINAGGKRLSVELDPNAAISVTAPNVMFAMPGDDVKITGLRNPKQPQLVQAESIEIKAAKPLGIEGSLTAKDAKNLKNSKTSSAANPNKKGPEKTDPKANAKRGKAA